ncbi:MAG: SIMPL domain-containing protein [Alphaproteobacteria bacterium]
MSDKLNSALIITGLLIAIGLSSAGYFASQTLYNAKVALNTAEVKGLAERRVKANRANWTVSFSIAGTSKAQIPALYKTSEQNQAKIIDILKDNGLDEAEITPGVIDYYYNEYRDDNQKLIDQRHTLTGYINVETDKVDQISKIRGEVNKLIAQGIQINNPPPTYRFTGLNDIKPEMLRDATKNARLAANEFAENADATVGGIRDARQGNFFVRDAGEEYGDTAKIEKDVRVVTTITFYLKD